MSELDSEKSIANQL